MVERGEGLEESAPKAGEDVFTEDDLAPSDDDVRALRRMRIDKAAVVVAVSALGVWVGGLVALGACAAPMVFEHTPYPFSGRAMGSAFARFDSIAIGCAVVALGAEVVRTLVSIKSGGGKLIARIRRYAAIALALAAVYSGMRLTPAIMELHEQGARRNIGPAGEQLESLHAQAELIGKLIVPVALALIALHVITLRLRTDDDEVVLVPAAPGQRKDRGGKHG